MTDNQREMIKVLRDLGHGYKSVAKETGLKLHTVRDYCRYHNLTGNASVLAVSRIKNNFGIKAEVPDRYCLVCGKMIAQADVTTRGRRKKHCSDKCRYQYRSMQR